MLPLVKPCEQGKGYHQNGLASALLYPLLSCAQMAGEQPAAQACLGDSSGFFGKEEGLDFLFGIMPCRGVPQTTQASAFREISAPQQVQYAAKDQLQ